MEKDPDVLKSNAPRIHRATLLSVMKMALLMLFCVAVTVLIGLKVAGGRSDAMGWGLFALFAIASVILFGITIGKIRTRIVFDETTIASVTRSKTVELRWGKISNIEQIRVGSDLVYVLKSASGKQINVDRGLERFEELLSALRERLGPLPGDPQ